MRGLSLAARAVALWCGGAILALGGCGRERDEGNERVGTVTDAIVNGSVDDTNAFSAVGKVIVGHYPAGFVECSGALIARRVFLTAAHCVSDHLTGATDLAGTPIRVAFAKPNGTMAESDVAFRGVDVTGVIASAGTVTFTSLQCPDAATSALIDHTKEPVLLLLADDAPPDVKPLPLMIDYRAKVFAAPGEYAATFGSFSQGSFHDLENWAATAKPIVTMVGYGTGSHGATVLRGRDFGAAVWVGEAASYSRGMLTCQTSLPNQVAPAVHTSALDLLRSSLPNSLADIANGASYNANESTAAPGDSGGPVIVGSPPLGPLSHGIVPTPLPANPPTGVFYDTGKYYLLGVGGFVSNFGDANGVHPGAIYVPIYTAGVTDFLVAALHDYDHDNLPDVVDTCPLGKDQNCVVCPCDPADPYDHDHDGFCGAPCPGQIADNCPGPTNVQQANANRASELAHDKPAVGDACDPAVAMDTRFDVEAFPQPPIFNQQHTAWLQCTRYQRSKMHLRPLASHDVFGVPHPVPTPTPTMARACQQLLTQAANIPCTFKDVDFQDAALYDFQNKPTTLADETLETHFHRVTLKIGNKVIGPSDPFGLFNYEELGEAASPAIDYEWDYASDYDRWVKSGLIHDEILPPDFGGDPNSPLGPHHLKGNFWIHADVPWGGDPSPGACIGTSCDVGAGTRGTQLNNFHATGPVLANGPLEYLFRPSFYECPTCGFAQVAAPAIPAPAGPNGGGAAAAASAAMPASFAHFVSRPASVPIQGDFSPSPAATGAAAILVPLAGGDLGALGSGCGDFGAQIVTSRVGPSLSAALSAGARFASAVEPSRAIGSGLGFPFAVAVSPTGNQIITLAQSSGATLAAPADAPVCAGPSTPSAPSFVRSFGSYGSGPGQLNFPVGIGVDRANDAYVVDRTNHRVCRFGSSGEFKLCWGQPGAADGEFGSFMATDGPYGLAVDRALARVCVADTVNSRVQCFDPNGAFLFKFGHAGAGPGELAAEFGLGIDSATHDIYVADTFNHRVQVFDAAGGYLRQWGSFGTANGELAYPRGVAADDRGNVYVAEYGNSRISKFDRNGVFAGKWGSPGSAPGQLGQAQAVAVDAAGLVYVADWSNNRVQVFSGDGTLLALWGAGGSGDGQFSGPIGIAVADGGQVYVTDHFQHRVQVFTPLDHLCPSCPSGQCAGGSSGVCCKQPCGAARDCASNYCSPSGFCELAPRIGSPHAKGFVPVLTSYRRGLFIVGGDDPDTGKPTGQIWFSALRDAAWALLPVAGYSPERVLGATYSFASDRLYVLDESGATARLVQIDPAALTVSVIGTWPRHSVWDAHFLVVDRDGGLLVASSNSKTRKHAIARFDVWSTPPKLDGIAKGNRQLLVEPVVDASGYTLVLWSTPGDESEDSNDDDVDVAIVGPKSASGSAVRTIRIAALKFKAAKLAHVGKQL